MTGNFWNPVINITGNVSNNKDGINEITCFPNPFSSSTTIQFSKEQSNTQVTILNLLGEVLNTLNFSGNKLKLEKDELADGIYLLQVMDSDKNSVTKKIIVK